MTSPADQHEDLLLRNVKPDVPASRRAQALADHIEKEIRARAIPPGTRLGTKDDLKQRFNVAIGTVNQTIRLLENRSIVDSRPGRGGGLFAARPSPRVRLSHLLLGVKSDSTTITNALAIRNALEELVCLDATEFATAGDIRELRRIINRMQDAQDNAAEFLRANWSLHRRLAEISPNELLRNLYLTLLDFIESELEDVAADDEQFSAASKNVEVHRKLVDAISSRDAAQVRRAAKRHAPVALRVS